MTRVGAIAVTKDHAQQVVSSLRTLNWLKAGSNVTSLHSRPGWLAVHVSSNAVPALDSITENCFNANANPEDTQHLYQIDQNAVRTLNHLLLNPEIAIWIPGLRVKSPDCIRIGGKAENVTYANIPSKTITHREHIANARFTFIELFAGIGGFRVACDALGGCSLFASEINEAARHTYAANFGNEYLDLVSSSVSYADAVSSSCSSNALSDSHSHQPPSAATLPPGSIPSSIVPATTSQVPILVGDITEIETDMIPDHHILTAGFPCQSFCKVGDRTALDDIRGELFFEVVRVLESKRPKAFLLENVANLVTMENGAVFSIIHKHLEDAGYTVLHKVIDAGLYVPQTRHRVYILGFSNTHTATTFTWPSPPAHRPQSLRTILLPDPPHPSLLLTPHQLEKLHASYTYKRDASWRIADCNGRARTLMSSYKSGFAMYSEFVPVPVPPPTSNTAEHDDTIPNAKRLKEEEEETDNPKLVEKSLPAQLRFYAPRECARIMGFPDTFSLDHCKTPGTLFHQLGNAVCPPVIQAIVESMLQALERETVIKK